jgi:hypothetical protein
LPNRPARFDIIAGVSMIPSTPNQVSLPPPPRRVRLRAGGFRGVWAPRLMLLPFMAIGAVFVYLVLVGPITLLFGAHVTGRVQSVTQRLPTSPDVNVRFSYDAGGVTATGRGYVNKNDTRVPAIGSDVSLRVLWLGPLTHAMMTDQPTSASGLICLGAFATAWCGMVGLSSLAVWLGPTLDRRMLRTGDAAAGVITEKTQVPTQKKIRYEVKYRFRTPDGVERDGKQRVDAEIFLLLREQQQVTVLYRARYPANNQLYEASSYECAGDR